MSIITRAKNHWTLLYGAKGSTRGLKGAPYRKECVADIQQLFDIIGFSEVGNGTIYVPLFEAALPYSGYVQTGSPVPGDLVILGDHDHIGVYTGNGGMISNSSGSGSFTWTASVSAQQNYFGYTSAPRYWHHQ